ncbi:MAG: DUF354 domain-containing protein [Thaumarchaeota archaeon]|nr:DUF354 domain-containing protein [Nitrososphaerota archaeon]
MKIWFDILTPKQLLFFEPMIRKLRKNNQVLCTSRNYREVVNLAKIRGINLSILGKHGGPNKTDKLKASLSRMHKLAYIAKKFAPEITVSFCSPEAARISYGFGIKHVAFSDSPHAEAVMRLSIPLVQKLLIPWIIPYREFQRYGIAKKDIIKYKAIDAAVIVRETSKKYSRDDFSLTKKKTILVRPEESQAAYISKERAKTTNIIREIIREFSDYNIVILGRYLSQIRAFKKEFGNKAIVMDKVVDGKSLLEFTDFFIGSGGTMTAEAALMGIPTISYNAVPNNIEEYLAKKGLLVKEKNSMRIAKIIKQIAKSDKNKMRRRAKTILSSMEDPFPKLLSTIKSL